MSKNTTKTRRDVGIGPTIRKKKKSTEQETKDKTMSKVRTEDQIARRKIRSGKRLGKRERKGILLLTLFLYFFSFMKSSFV